jgi:hypothetical protein
MSTVTSGSAGSLQVLNGHSTSLFDLSEGLSR